MITEFNLWLASMFLGVYPASVTAMSMFFIAGITIATLPAVLGVLLYPRAIFGHIVAGSMLMFASITLGIMVAITPMTHDLQFVQCEYRPGMYREFTVYEQWCANRTRLDRPFPPAQFVGFR